MQPYRYLWHHWGGTVIPATMELVLDGLPSEGWLKQLAEFGEAGVWGGWIEDTEWTMEISV